MPETPAAGRIVADFVQSCPPLPEDVRTAGRRALLNMTGCAIGGAGEPAIDTLAAMLPAFSGLATATIVGRPERADMLWAAYLNAAAANIFDFDDTHIPTVIHPAAPVGPAVLALAETLGSQGRPVPGAVLLDAFILGMEVCCRLGLTVHPQHYARGWHITSTCGVFGAALACGRILGLTAEQLHDALGNALAQSSGAVETLGTMSKSLSVGGAARGGLMAALLARDGYTGPAGALEGERGFFNLHSDTPDIGKLIEGLGSRWEVLNVAFKPYPCGVVLNPVIEACLGLHAEGGFAADEIESVVLRGHPLLRQRTDRPGVTSGRLAQVSAQHAVPVSLLRGRADLQAFSDESVMDPALRAFGERVSFQDDPSVAVEAAEVRLRFRDGREVVRRIAAARGGLERPMSDADLAEKLTAQIAYRGLALPADELIAAIDTIETAGDGAGFLALTRPQ